jgi:hypothetical protein
MQESKVNIEKFSGSFSTEQQGCSIFINSTINLITDGFALGVYAYLMCRPPGWELNAKQLANHFGCNKSKIYKHLSFLKNIGLMTCKSIREKGKFSSLHYTVHLSPKSVKSQSQQGISPRMEKSDVVTSYVEKVDTYKTKNIQNKDNKKTTTTPITENKQKSSSDFVINREADKELLKLKKKYLSKDKRTDEEFLRECSHHLDNGDKQKYNLTRRLKGLSTIISKGFFETPAGYKSHKIIKSVFTPEDAALISAYNHFIGLTKIKPNMKIEDFMNPVELRRVSKFIFKKEKKYG